jgi:NADP-dependent 3-hydroxy acid dehydrogenase YdfG/Flp pilus assembly protein TadD
MSKLLLAYCIENQQIAAQIAQALNGKIDVEKIIFDQNNGIKYLEKQAQQSNAPVLVLVSDNFLKTESCMNDALRILQSLGNMKRLIPVTTEGVYSKAGNGQYQTVPTSFDRVSNVIQYMNYWQDQYLELRRVKPENQDETSFNNHVKSVRAISTEIGELLRYMRAMDYFSFDQFVESNYIILYRVLSLEVPAGAENYKKVAIAHTVMPESRIESVAAINVPRAEPVHETVEKDYKNGQNTEGPSLEQLIKTEAAQSGHSDLELKDSSLDLNAIPGYSMLQNRVMQQPVEEHIEPVVSPKAEPESGYSSQNFQQYADELINQGLDTPTSLEALIEEIKHESQTEFEKNASVSTNHHLEQIVEDAVKEDGKKVENIIGTDIKKPIDLHIADTFTLSENDKKDAELVQMMEEMKATSELKAAEIVPPVEIVDIKNETIENVEQEETIKQEVSRIFNETQAIPTRFDYEKDNSDVKNEEKVALEPQNGHSSNGVHNSNADKSELVLAHEALSKDPLNTTLRFQYAENLTKNNRFQDSIEQLEILIEDDRTNVDAYMMMAYAAEQSGDYLLSLNCLEKVSLLKPNYQGIYYKLGNLVNEHFKNHKRKAHRYYKDAIEHDTQNSDAYYQFAMLDLEQNGDYNTAIENLQKAVAINPEHSNASFELAKAYYEIGDKTNASLFYLKATETNPSIKTKINDDIFKQEIIEPAATVNDNGKVVLITGATSGIGRATAEIFAKNGYRLILTGRRFDRLEAVKAVFEEDYKNKIHILNFDVRNVQSVKVAIDSLDEEFKNVDILINNAGLASGLAPIHEGDIEDWEAMIDTNIKGLLYMTRAIAPHMVARQKGHIINVGSIAGKEVYPLGNVYVASKHAVDALTRAMRSDLFKHNIRVSQVAPGMVEETEFALVRFHGDAEKAKIYDDIQPLKASDIAETIYYIVTRPEHVNIQDVVMMCTQQGSANLYNRSGRKDS